MMRAIRSPVTHFLGLACLAVAVLAGGVAGQRLLGLPGALAGGLLGTMAAVYFYLRVIIERRARMFVPVVEKEVDWSSEYADLIRAHDDLKAMSAKAVSTR
jgi:hypothetical protein